MDAMTSLALIWAAVFLATIAARWSRLTPVLWFLFFGAIMVNTGLLPEHADPFIAGFAELGIIVIMFAIGFEEDTSEFIDSIKKSWGIAFFGGVAPFTAAYFVADYFWHDVNISLMCGLTMTATAVSLTMVSLHSEGLGQSKVASRIMTSALLDDIASLALLAVLVPIASGSAAVTPVGIALIMGKSIAFFLIMSLLGAWIFPHKPKGWFRKVPFLGRVGIASVLKFGKGEHATLTVLLMAVLIGLLAHEFGFHPAVGAFMAGLILKQEYFHFSNNTKSHKQTSQIIDNVAFSWLGPVFFVHLGAQIIFKPDVLMAIIPHVIVMTLVLAAAQIASASIAARYTGGMRWPGAVMIGFGMLGRAELAFVVMDIAYTQNHILSIEAFYTLMITAFWLNLAVPITIRMWKPVYQRDLDIHERVVVPGPKDYSETG
ncbi:MAG: cation/H(+) antiporter [Robiginitomaculum sp.]|nr:MAG: cation/H(+) antiporter [Robiginitomaculum sp.]